MAATASTSTSPQILVVGQTGHGKSTLINRLANYFLNGSLASLQVAIPTGHLQSNLQYRHSEKAVGKVSVSQTLACTTYSFVHHETGRSYRFIDTPGLSDTKGADERNLSLIVKAAQESSPLTAIVLIVNGTVGRYTVDIENTLVRLRQIIPNVLLDNILVVFTNCQEHTCNFAIESLRVLQKPGQRSPFSKEKIFHLNNTSFSSDPRLWTDRQHRRLQIDWEDGQACLDRLIQAVHKLHAVIVPAIEKTVESVIALLDAAVDGLTTLLGMRDELAHTLSRSGMGHLPSISSAAASATEAISSAIAIKAHRAADECQSLLSGNFLGVDVLDTLRTTVSQLQMASRGRSGIVDRLQQERSIQAHSELVHALNSGICSQYTATDEHQALTSAHQGISHLNQQVQVERAALARAEQERRLEAERYAQQERKRLEESLRRKEQEERARREAEQRRQAERRQREQKEAEDLQQARMLLHLLSLQQQEQQQRRRQQGPFGFGPHPPFLFGPPGGGGWYY